MLPNRICDTESANTGGQTPMGLTRPRDRQRTSATITAAAVDPELDSDDVKSCELAPDQRHFPRPPQQQKQKQSGDSHGSSISSGSTGGSSSGNNTHAITSLCSPGTSTAALERQQQQQQHSYSSPAFLSPVLRKAETYTTSSSTNSSGSGNNNSGGVAQLPFDPNRRNSGSRSSTSSSGSSGSKMPVDGQMCRLRSSEDVARALSRRNPLGLAITIPVESSLADSTEASLTSLWFHASSSPESRSISISAAQSSHTSAPLSITATTGDPHHHRAMPLPLSPGSSEGRRATQPPSAAMTRPATLLSATPPPPPSSHPRPTSAAASATSAQGQPRELLSPLLGPLGWERRESALVCFVDFGTEPAEAGALGPSTAGTGVISAAPPRPVTHGGEESAEPTPVVSRRPRALEAATNFAAFTAAHVAAAPAVASLSTPEVTPTAALTRRANSLRLPPPDPAFRFPPIEGDLDENLEGRRGATELEAGLLVVRPPAEAAPAKSSARFHAHRAQQERQRRRQQQQRRRGARDAVDTLIPGLLFIGGVRAARNEAALGDLGITAFLNVACDVAMPEHVVRRAPGAGTLLPAELAAAVVAAGGECGGSGLAEYLHLPLRDRGDELLAAHFRAAFGFIRACAAARRRVLLFCREGKSRSGAMAIAFVMDELRLSYNAALDYVRERRQAVDPNLSFCSQLSNPSMSTPHASPMLTPASLPPPPCRESFGGDEITPQRVSVPTAQRGGADVVCVTARQDCYDAGTDPLDADTRGRCGAGPPLFGSDVDVEDEDENSGSGSQRGVSFAMSKEQTERVVRGASACHALPHGFLPQGRGDV